MEAEIENNKSPENERLLRNAPTPHIYGSKQPVCF